ncbi:SDR family NAD(P)-dependent oxidoreductase [Psychromonas sp. 14N.309.X.WAT.B.A12]|uniref:SDR family NAD(P)-dependent oxidoreductase n=1 Tax=Psychromonas sp. 14N.309.X.WAT.B.A12 TaxID=2998322 RepID=UPI0025B259F9|nr:SDR family NAD(P)-dependent oxidoreductase [Psychromonas sp. 14N.309.X.WAT.B.A12]MDN2662220.1 SDR family NAD(P)-dependent oxidoreductase [Psychromonas sp. 14N.309.X.WAT.B.A12]
MMTAKNILITGATSGIGHSLFDYYHQLGNNVIACGRNQEKLQEMAEQAYMTGQFDMTIPSEIEAFSKSLDSLDILVLNAGNCRYIDDAKHFDGALFADVIQTNLISLGWLLQYFLPKVREGGQVVFVSSSATLMPFQRSEAYGASKSGVDYLANSLRLDLIKYKIDVTLIHPGFIKTPLTEKNDFPMPFLLTSEEAAQHIAKAIDNRKEYAHFPKCLTTLLTFFSIMPNWIWRKLIVKG